MSFLTDPWSEASYERQAFVHALQLYRQEKDCYECWEMLLGSEEQVSFYHLNKRSFCFVTAFALHSQVLAAQLMQEVLPWLQSQLQNKVKGKKTERIHLWLAVSDTDKTNMPGQLASPAFNSKAGRPELCL